MYVLYTILIILQPCSVLGVMSNYDKKDKSSYVKVFQFPEPVEKDMNRREKYPTKLLQNIQKCATGHQTFSCVSL